MTHGISYGELATCCDEFDRQKATLGITFESEEREQEAQMAFIDEYESGNDDPQLSEIITMYNL